MKGRPAPWRRIVAQLKDAGALLPGLSIRLGTATPWWSLLSVRRQLVRLPLGLAGGVSFRVPLDNV
jgi:hypothetical protein